ncbi:E3 ubiquitin-protein ligase TRIM21-like [Brachyistius frenatus]|uniref:E3 ubiquitin-protein ligase TRIM21-like n=1 Tax=Brachyistius frenatus TaxID=100188 RepID=UPI0037E76DC8
MASARSLMQEENFLCSICLQVFTRPVTIPCGHNFCLHCITDYWDTLNDFVQCPLCKEQFHLKPTLRVNILIAEMAVNFNKSSEEKSSSPPKQAGSGNVLCDHCTGAKLTAVKSCLVCFMSYCQTHLEPHQRIAAMKKHKLIDPAENLESRMCKNHHEPLELFCQVDQMFLCASCKTKDHKTHKIVTLEEEAQMRKTQLGLEKQSTDQMILARQQKILKIQHSLEASRNNAEKALKCSSHMMTAVMAYIKRSIDELTQVIETKQKKNETDAKGFTDELQVEIRQIQQKHLQLNQISLTRDPLTFLENLLPLEIASPKVKDWSDVTLKSDVFPVQAAIAKLETTVRREISMLCDPDFKEKQRHATDVTLDPDTANSSLYVSEDGKQVAHTNRKTGVPNKPERFDHVLNVLAKKGFLTGKLYYEVEIKDKTQWDVGIANESINRKGDLRLSPKNGYWTICLRKGNEFTANTNPAINLYVGEMPQKVGVFADYDEGLISFYDVDARASIFSFTDCKFTEQLFPFFSPGANDGGANSAPLIITPVKVSASVF